MKELNLQEIQKIGLDILLILKKFAMKKISNFI